MRSSLRLARTSLSILALLAPAAGLSACATRTVIVPSVGSPCSDLIPPSWLLGVPGAPLPAETAAAGPWIAFGDAQTGQLDKANGRTVDSVEIVKKCEARDREIAAKLVPKPWWRFW